VSVFSLDHFKRFCSHLHIDSKERGQIPFKWIGTQTYAMDEIAKGLEQGIHTFFILKGRQLGISTVSIALDLYWMYMHNGLQGALVTDTDDNRDLFKSYLTQYQESLPSRARVQVAQHNRTQLVLKNRSRLSYIVAGKRKNESLGAGKAVNFMHGTECASWGDQDGMGSLVATLAQQNPKRLYVFESTAFGYNMWYELCEQAKDATSERLIFVGWWRNEFYRKERTSLEFRTYWDGEPTPDEREWMHEIFVEYKYNVQPEQLAWWRWYLAEKVPGSEINLMYQQFPPTASYAFQMSGSKYFSPERVNVTYKRAIEQKAEFYRYEFGLHFEQTKLVQTSENAAQLRIWQEPVAGARYILGADPAYGSSEWADLFAISIWRCFSDRMVQVAEVGTADFRNEAEFAWVLAHLAGTYQPCMVNLEMDGPGRTVFNELQNLKRYAGSPGLEQGSRDIYNVVNSIRDYLYKRQDSMNGTFAFQWQTTATEKMRMMATLRNYFEREMLDINSAACAAQFRNIHREGQHIGGEGRAKDDLVIAAGLAVIGWNDWIKGELEMENRTYAYDMRPKGESRTMNSAERVVSKFFRMNGIRTSNGDQ
jgi:hypothetical protein